MRSFAVALLVFATLQFGFRGMQRVRSEVPLWDFASVYSASRTWIHGNNPYDKDAVLATWKSTGAFADRDASYFATVYPPSSLLILLPFAVLPIKLSMTLWLALTVVLLAIQFMLLARMAGLQWSDARSMVLLGASLAAAPYQFGVLSGQLSIPAIALVVIACFYANEDRSKLAGIFLGIACALKPQVGAPFLAYYLLRQRPAVVINAVLSGGLLLLCSIVAMRWSHIDWIHGWHQSIASTQQLGAVNDYGWSNSFRDEIIDLKMLLISVIHQPRLLQFLVLSFVFFLGLRYIAVFPGVFSPSRKPTPRHELLLLSAIWAMSLLPIYHRIYDVAFLATALAWCLTASDKQEVIAARWLLVPMAIFLIPFDIVAAVARRSNSLDRLSHSPLWQGWFAPHYSWAILLVSGGLLLAVSRFGSESTASEEFPSLGKSADALHVPSAAAA